MKTLLPLVLFFVTGSLMAQPRLELGKSVNATLDPAKMDSYLVHIKKGEFASIRINQRNVSLYTLILDPRDTLVQVVDDNGLGQDDIVSLYADISGDYTVKVGWNFQKPLTGTYNITLDRLEKTGRDSIRRANQLFDSWYKNSGPGGAVVVVKNSQVIFESYKGLGNMDESVPLTKQSVFELASVSKQFTALAVAMLIEQQKLTLSDDIRKYLPEMADYGKKISVANLVYQTSGLRDFVNCFQFSGITPEDLVTSAMVLRFACKQKHVKFSPGERYNYSNTNYVLLAEIVKRVAGVPFDQWIKKNIFEPLNMHSTFFKSTPGQVYANKVISYRPAAEAYEQRLLNNAVMGSQACYSTGEDLAKWVNHFSDKQLITPLIDSLLSTTGTLNDGKKTNYSFGNSFSTYKGFDKIEHLGLFCGYRTSIARFPGERLSVIYLSNDDNDATYGRATKIANLFLNVPPDKASINRLPDAAKVLQDIRVSDTTVAKIPPEEFTGTYFSEELESSLSLEIKNGRLNILHTRLNDISLKHVKDDNFGFIDFLRGSNGKISGMRIRGEGVEFVKIQ